MEIVNFADRFLSGRRAARTRALDLLIDHLMSQGGQRVLLRLELQADTEIERTYLLGDPLRSAFQRDVDPEVSELGLSVAIRAYADRLILESARQHQAQANPGHRVQLLTSDQGLARMALGEGIVPLFFGSVVAADVLGKRLTGATLDPFTGGLRETSLASLAWELATGVVANPYPSSSQTSNNPHYALPTDEEAEARIVSFLRDGKSQVVVVEGTQGVGKTNFLNHFELEIRDALSELDGYYLVRYLADPEASFEGTIRRLFQELGVEHLRKLAGKLRQQPDLRRTSGR